MMSEIVDGNETAKEKKERRKSEDRGKARAE